MTRRRMTQPRLARAKTMTKALLDLWPTAKALAYEADDLSWGLKRRMGRIQSASGSTHCGVATEDSVAYVEQVFNDYVTYGGLDELGGTAVEVGPGDNAGVALLLRTAGCETVELVDRFRSRRSPAQQAQIYQALAVRHRLERPEAAGLWNDERLPGIIWRLGSSAEDYFARHAHSGQQRYDLIVSRAAMEHLYDPMGAIANMAACLRPGGRMVHKIDLRDHGMFTPAHSELTFLRFPTPVHRRMTRRSGRPNRFLFHRYRSLADELGRSADLDVSILVTSLAGEGELLPHLPVASVPAMLMQRAVARVEAERHDFAAEFVKVASEDLAVTGIFWVGVRRTAEQRSVRVSQQVLASDDGPVARDH